MEQNHDHGSEVPLWERPNEDILREFVARSAHDTGRTAHTHASRIRAQLSRYAAVSCGLPYLKEVVLDPELWGAVLDCDVRLSGAGHLTRGSLNGTRNSFAA